MTAVSRGIVFMGDKIRHYSLSVGQRLVPTDAGIVSRPIAVDDADGLPMRQDRRGGEPLRICRR